METEVRVAVAMETGDRVAVAMETEDRVAVAMETEDRLRQLLLDLKNDMTSDDLESLKFRQNIPAGIKEELRKPLDAWDYYEREGDIDYEDEERTLGFLRRLLDPGTFGGSRRLYGHVLRYQERYGLAPVSLSPGREDEDLVDSPEPENRSTPSKPSRHGARTSKKSRFFLSLFSCVRTTESKSVTDAPVTLSTLPPVPPETPPKSTEAPLPLPNDALPGEELEPETIQHTPPQKTEPFEPVSEIQTAETSHSEPGIRITDQTELLSSEPQLSTSNNNFDVSGGLDDVDSAKLSVKPAVSNIAEPRADTKNLLVKPGANNKSLPTLRDRLFIFP